MTCFRFYSIIILILVGCTDDNASNKRTNDPKEAAQELDQGKFEDAKKLRKLAKSLVAAASDVEKRGKEFDAAAADNTMSLTSTQRPDDLQETPPALQAAAAALENAANAVDATNGHIIDAQATLTLAQSQRTNADQALARASADYQSYQSQLSEHNTQLEARDREFLRLKQQLDELQSGISDTTVRLEETVAELEGRVEQREDNYNALATTLQTTQDLNSQLQQSKAAIEAKTNELQTTVTNMRAANAQLQTQIDNYITPFTALQAAVDALNQTITLLSSNSAEIISRAASLLSAAEDISEVINTLTSTYGIPNDSPTIVTLNRIKDAIADDAARISQIGIDIQGVRDSQASIIASQQSAIDQINAIRNSQLETLQQLQAIVVAQDEIIAAQQALIAEHQQLLTSQAGHIESALALVTYAKQMLDEDRFALAKIRELLQMQKRILDNNPVVVPHGLPGYASFPHRNPRIVDFAAGRWHVASEAGFSSSSDDGSTWVTKTSLDGVYGPRVRSVFGETIAYYYRATFDLWNSFIDLNEWAKNHAAVVGDSDQLVTIDRVQSSRPVLKRIRRSGERSEIILNVVEEASSGPLPAKTIVTSSSESVVSWNQTYGVYNFAVLGNKVLLGSEKGLNISLDAGENWNFVPLSHGSGLPRNLPRVFLGDGFMAAVYCGFNSAQVAECQLYRTEDNWTTYNRTIYAVQPNAARHASGHFKVYGDRLFRLMNGQLEQATKSGPFTLYASLNPDTDDFAVDVARDILMYTNQTLRIRYPSSLEREIINGGAVSGVTEITTDDNAIWVAATGNGTFVNKLLRSVDGGKTFSSVPTTFMRTWRGLTAKNGIAYVTGGTFWEVIDGVRKDYFILKKISPSGQVDDIKLQNYWPVESGSWRVIGGRSALKLSGSTILVSDLDNIWISNDGGESFSSNLRKEFATWPMSYGINDIDVTRDGNILLASDDGLYVMRKVNGNWQLPEKIADQLLGWASHVDRIVKDEIGNIYVHAAIPIVSYDDGKSFRRLNLSSSETIAVSGRYVFVAGLRELYRSQDAGKSFENITPAITPSWTAYRPSGTTDHYYFTSVATTSNHMFLVSDGTLLRMRFDPEITGPIGGVIATEDLQPGKTMNRQLGIVVKAKKGGFITSVGGHFSGEGLVQIYNYGSGAHLGTVELLGENRWNYEQLEAPIRVEAGAQIALVLWPKSGAKVTAVPTWKFEATETADFTIECKAAFFWGSAPTTTMPAKRCLTSGSGGMFWGLPDLIMQVDP